VPFTVELGFAEAFLPCVATTSEKHSVPCRNAQSSCGQLLISSFCQICNAGFIVLNHFRGMGIATALAQSYVENAPQLGYRASVFNLVYVNNFASVR